jgi:hypothetical protein
MVGGEVGAIIFPGEGRPISSIPPHWWRGLLKT